MENCIVNAERIKEVAEIVVAYEGGAVMLEKESEIGPREPFALARPLHIHVRRRI